MKAKFLIRNLGNTSPLINCPVHALFQGTVCSKHRLELMLYMLLVQRNGVKVKNVIFWNNQFCSTESGTLFACI